MRARCLLAYLALACGLASAGAALAAGDHSAAPPTPAPAAAPPPAAEPEGPPQPWRLIRTLQRLQAQMAQGSTIAQQAQPRVVSELAEAFAAADAALWRAPRNAAAAAALLLSGGDPRALRRRFDEGAFGEDAPAVEAALAFAEGRAEEARRRLDEIEPDLYGASIAAQFALVQASLERDAPDRANALFDRARLLSPGGLIEETALRRQIRLAEERLDGPRYVRLASQYARRFSRSVYAGSFRERAPQTLAALALASPEPTVRPYEGLLADFDAAERGVATLAIARAALEKGRFDLALAAARRTLELTPSLSREAESAAAYAVAVGLLTEGPGVVGRLAHRREPTRREDRQLLAAAAAVAAQVYVWPPTAPAAAPSEPPPDPTETMARAERALAATAQLPGAPIAGSDR